ncbi:MAG: DUF1003 domain-containing protein [Candidatus Wolfebacteria bacterium]|nr:DUF1003 domain-containing protein [Candidatus Wolfebacteria bacterium]
MEDMNIKEYSDIKFSDSAMSAENANVRHKRSFTPLERFAVWITDKVGTMGFFFIILGWTILWLGWNTIVSDDLKFDSFPAFVLWLFISNMIQLFLLPLIMIGQNLQGRHAEFRAESDFEINQKSEKEIETILFKLEKQEELELKILRHLEELKPKKKARS